MINENSLPLIIDSKDFPENSIENLIHYIIKDYEKVNILLMYYGAILFRGFNINTVNDFEYLVSSLPISNLAYIGGDSPRTKLSKKVYTSTEYPADQSIALHNEMSFSNNYPKYLFFYCELPSSQGGETPLADNRELYKQLPASLIQKYQQKKLKYVMNLHSGYGIGKSWQDVFETDSRDELETILNRRGVTYSWKNENLKIIEIVQPVINHPKTKEWIFFSQAHQWHPSNLDYDTYESLIEMITETDFYHYVCYADDEPLDKEELELTRKIIDNIKIINPWKKGDFLFIDNLLCMHGRNPFKGERKIRLSLAN